MKRKVIVKTMQMTKGIINNIIKIDKTFYKNFDYNNTSWYSERYKKENLATLLFVGRKIVGYFIFCTISDNLFNEVLNLKYYGDYHFPASEVNIPSNNYYIPSVLVLDKYRSYSLPLLIALKKEILLKEKVVTIAISKEGKKISSTIMQKIGSPKENIEVYAYFKDSALSHSSISASHLDRGANKKSLGL